MNTMRIQARKLQVMVTGQFTCSQVLKASLAVKDTICGILVEKMVTGLATINATLHPFSPQVTQFTSPGCTETKTGDTNKECWYLN